MRTSFEIPIAVLVGMVILGFILILLTGCAEKNLPISLDPMDFDFFYEVHVLADSDYDQLPAEDENPQEKASFSMELTASPNPFNPTTRIKFNLPKPGKTVVSIFDLKGRLVKDLLNGLLSEGTQEMNWDGTTNVGREASSGLYIVRISTGDSSQAIRITLAK